MHETTAIKQSIGAVLAIAVCVSTHGASAQNSVWIGGTGSWATLANWQSGLVPNASRDAFVNNGGAANVTFTGDALAKSLTIGQNVGQSGTVGVFAGNSLTIGNSVTVGNAGAGALSTSGGGRLTVNSNLTLGKLPSSTGIATVTGAGSAWSSFTISIGDQGSGNLLIENGGETGSFDTAIGVGTGSIGTVTVTGAGSLLNQADLSIGQSGAGTLNVASGGVVSSSRETFIGGSYSSETGTGSVSVLGAGSQITTTRLRIGSSGTGQLTIADGGLVRVSPYWLDNSTPQTLINSLSTVNIGAGGLAGTLDTGMLSNNGTLTFNHTDAITQSAAISGTGAIQKLGAGSTTLTNAAAFTGTISASAGHLNLQGSLGASSYTAFGGTLRFDSSTMNLTAVGAVRASGGAVEYSGATINGGALRGQLPGVGTHTIVSGATTTRFNGVTIFNSADVIQNASTNFTSGTNGGRLTSNAPLFYDGGTNTASGNIIVNNTINTRDFINYGQITVSSSGTLFHKQGNLASGGGSRITINAGGFVNLMEGAQLDLNGALLVNNGLINGVVNVNYGSLAKGGGSYDVVNVFDGGVYSPGNSPGTVTAASLSFASTSTIGGPTLAIELGGGNQAAEYDYVNVTGLLSLGGRLDVLLVSDFNPSLGNAFDILDWGSLSGAFGSLSLPSLSAGLCWDTTQLYTTGTLSVIAAAGLPGDYNGDGHVDAADYTAWRDNLGSATQLLNDDTPGVAQDDLLRWKANFGQPVGGGFAAPASVPEPTAAAIFLAGLITLAGLSSQRWVKLPEASGTVVCHTLPRPRLTPPRFGVRGAMGGIPASP